MNKSYAALLFGAACSMSQLAASAPSTRPALKPESCTLEEAKAQAGMNTIFGGIKSPLYVDGHGKPLPPKAPRKCPPSKAEQEAAMRTIYGNIHSRAYVKGQSK